MATQKFKALTHFIIHECVDNPSRLGATRLNKALFYADVEAYRRTGKSISDDKYIKRERGPVPKHVLATLHELKSEGAIHIQEPQVLYDTRHYTSLKEPDDSCLNSEEKKIARSALNFVCGMSATAVSDYSHDIIWEAAHEGEEIPLYAILAAHKGQIDQSVMNWADKKLGEIA